MTNRMLAALGALAVISSAPHTDVPGTPEGYRVATLPTLARKSGHDPLKDTLIALEKESWQAWQRRDSAFFQTFLSDDHVEVGFRGITGKAAVVASVGSRACVVQSFAIDAFELTKFSSTVAVLTYHAAQQTVCQRRTVPSPVWVSSLYVRRGGRWLNALYQQSQALP